MGCIPSLNHICLAGDADKEGQWFQEIRMPPCTLSLAMYDRVLTALLRGLKGSAPIYATAALKQVHCVSRN